MHTALVTRDKINLIFINRLFDFSQRTTRHTKSTENFGKEVTIFYSFSTSPLEYIRLFYIQNTGSKIYIRLIFVCMKKKLKKI